MPPLSLLIGTIPLHSPPMERPLLHTEIRSCHKETLDFLSANLWNDMPPKPPSTVLLEDSRCPIPSALSSPTPTCLHRNSAPSRMGNLLPPASPPNLAVQGAPRCLVSAVPAPDDQPDTRRPRLLGGSRATQPAGLNCAVLPRPHGKQDEGGKDENKMLC